MMSFRWPLMCDNVSAKDKDALIEFIKQEGVRFTNSHRVREFERAWSEWLGVKYSLFVNSGSSANFISVAIMRDLCGFGEVIVSPIGWPSDIVALHNARMQTVLCDVNLSNMALDCHEVSAAVNDATKGIMLVHTLGFNGLTGELCDLINDCDLFLIEDCCESHGAMFRDRKVGTFGNISNFSFYFGHHMTTIEGGMICTDDDEIYELARMYRSHGMTRECTQKRYDEYTGQNLDLNPLFTFAVCGFNMRNTELNAVLGLSQLDRLDDAIEARQRRLALWLDSLDADVFFTDFDTRGNSSFALPLLTLHDHDFCDFESVLDDLGVEFRKGMAGGGNQARQPYMKMIMPRHASRFSNADQIHDHSLYVGNHDGVDDEMIHEVADALNEVAHG